MDEPLVEIANQQTDCPIDEERIRRAVLEVLLGEGLTAGSVSVAVVDDPAIHELNKRYLDHDDPTDVISFPLERREGYVEGEIVVSAETARTVAADFDWPVEDELLLYVVHGALHLAGYDDLSESDRERMRQREKHYLGRFELEPPWERESGGNDATATSSS